MAKEQTIINLTNPPDPGRKWLKLSPQLIAVLQELAEMDEVTLEQLIISLINEGLAHRLRHR